jgi:quinoprotein glucose dehydrogenase
MEPIKKYFPLGKLLILFSLIFFGGCHAPETADKIKMDAVSTDWPMYGGNKSGNRYSLLTQVNLKTVDRLKIAWSYESERQSADGTSTLKNSDLQCQPIVVNGVLYATSPKLKLFALDAATGKRIWQFDPFANRQFGVTTCRGVVYWEEGSDKRIFYTAGSFLYAVDAGNGSLMESFGDSGRIDLHTGLDLNYDVKKLYVAATSPGVIYKNTLILGSAVSEGGDAAPGYIRGFDTKSGKLKWIFHTIPEPGEQGYDTWPKDAHKKIGAANNWSGLTIDEKRGAVFLGTGSPASDYYGGDRAGINLYSDCILCLDAETGKLKWYFQTIHHDLWDRDLPCPPNLTTIVHNGRKTDVLVQATKDGLIYVLDRDSGNSIFPIEERDVPVNGLPGEHPWPVQKYPVRPLPISNQVFSETDITELSPASHAFIKNIFDSTDHSNKFLPPGEKGTLLYGYSGGAEWGGNAIDSAGVLYQNANNCVWKLQMQSRSEFAKNNAFDSQGQHLFNIHCSACHGMERNGNGAEVPGLRNINKRFSEKDISEILREGRRRMPSFKQLSPEEIKMLIQFVLDKNPPENISEKSKNSLDRKLNARSGQQGSMKENKIMPYDPPYRAKVWTKLYDPDGFPAVKPPWGTLNAIDLKTGEYRWRVPLGEYPELTKRGTPVTGTENYGGPLVTEGGLVFIAATRDEKLRAFNKYTGKIVWETKLPAAGFATPVTYAVNGRQFIVIAAGGGRGLKSGVSYIAYALSND